MRKCTLCGEEIHPKRLEILPKTSTCVSCSAVGKKAGVNVVLGEGDHTCNEIVILEPEEFEKYRELEYKINGKRKDDLPHPEDEIEEDDEEEVEVIDINELKNVDLSDLNE